MPDDWDGVNPLSRYQSSGIEITDTPSWTGMTDFKDKVMTKD
jgi:hypothetical protein